MTAFAFVLLAAPLAWAAPSVSPGPSPAAPALVAASTPPITVVFPQENRNTPAIQAESIFGRIYPPTGKLTINGQPVKATKKGAFLAYLPVQSGAFTFQCRLEVGTQTYTLDRHIQVAPPLTAYPPDRLAIDPERLDPSQDLELGPGEWVNVEMKGTPGAEASFHIPGLTEDLGMTEVDPKLGIYQGTYQIQPGDRARLARVRFELQKAGLGKERGEAKGRLSVRSGSPRVARVQTEYAFVEMGPGEGYLFSATTGALLVVTGSMASSARSAQSPVLSAWLNSPVETLRPALHALQVRLSPSLSAWVNAQNILLLVPGTAVPQAKLTGVRVDVGEDTSTLKIGLTQKVPYRVDGTEDGSALRVTLYYTQNVADWTPYPLDDGFLGDMRIEQLDTQTSVLHIKAKGRAGFWGYHADFQNGGLVLQVRKPPAFERAPASALKNRVIAIDPGHNDMEERVGPLGNWERDLNMGVAQALVAALEKEGAKPVLTRNPEESVPLPDRPKAAYRAGADVFLSIHHNALPDGSDPLEKPRGYIVFYYHPHSLRFAKAVHAAYGPGYPYPSEGLVQRNLLVTRTTEMPAVLTESAYFMLPEQEERAADPKFQKKLAQVFVRGLRNFFEAERSRPGARLKAWVKPAPAPKPTPKSVSKPASPAKPKAVPKAAAPSKASPASKTKARNL